MRERSRDMVNWSDEEHDEDVDDIDVDAEIAAQLVPDEAPAADTLIPIRLDVKVDNHHVEDVICWNPGETGMTPKEFALLFCHDVNLPVSAHEQIVEQMNEQIAAVYDSTTNPEGDAPNGGDGGEECRHVVRLEVRIGRVVIRDQFEWDISERLNNADAFAERLCSDLGLNTEHVGAVAHAVREHISELIQFRNKRQSGATLKEEDLVRPHYKAELWQPHVQCLTLDEQEKVERREKREARLQRRNRGKADIYVPKVAGRGSGSKGRTSGRRRTSSARLG